MKIIPKTNTSHTAFGLALAVALRQAADSPVAELWRSSKKRNILILMTDDTGGVIRVLWWWCELGHRQPNIDRVAKEGAVFTC